MLRAKQWSIFHYFYNAFDMTRSGIEPTTSRSRGERSNHWATAADITRSVCDIGEKSDSIAKDNFFSQIHI